MATKGEGTAADSVQATADTQNQDTMTMVQDALDRGNAVLAFQPVMQARCPEIPAFYEGLIRVLDDREQIIPASRFIDAVETQDTGRRVDRMAFDLALQELADEPSLRLSINMSARSIGYRPWLETLEHGLKIHPTIGERLILEISESSAMVMPDLVSGFMSDLQSRGIAFALDNFGAGHMAFQHLRGFYFDLIKIDGALSRDVHKSPDNQVLVRALVAQSAHFDMFTVAEAVEGPEDAAFLISAGIDCLQGQHFAAPTLCPPWRAPRNHVEVG